MSKKVKVNLIGALDMLKFKNLAKDRDDKIEAAEASDVHVEDPLKDAAHAMHPVSQEMVIDRVTEHPGCSAKTFELKRKDGKPAAMFRAGQYISVSYNIDGEHVTRPYSIASSPLQAKSGKYSITIKSFPGGFTSVYAMRYLKEGMTVNVSAPEGYFYHEPLRDGDNVVALVGGSSITPVLSMALAIRDGVEDFNLTVIYGSRTAREILLYDELGAVAAECDKVKVIHVLSHEKRPGFEYGLITADLVRKYTDVDTASLLVCGPPAMTAYMREELKKLDIPPRRIRFEMEPIPEDVSRCSDYPASCAGKRFKLTVRQSGKEYRATAAADESLLVAMERARIIAPSSCRSGVCGLCRSKLLSGTVYIPAANDKRRHTDKETGYIHPCATFPVSDMEIEVPGEYV